MSILKELKEERVFYVEIESDKTMISIIEACDENFYMFLDKIQLSMLIAELKSIHETLIDPSPFN